MKKKMGRPTIGTQPAKVFFAARFTPAEAKRLDAAIRRAGQSKSAFVRKSLLKSADMANMQQ
jgi:hypothetical protein